MRSAGQEHPVRGLSGAGLRPAWLAAWPGPVPGSRHALLLLASAMLLAMTTWFSATAVLPQLRTAWTLTTVQASFLAIAVQVGFVVGALVSAVAQPRRGLPWFIEVNPRTTCPRQAAL